MDIIQKRQFLQEARENMQDGSWLPWKDAIQYKEGDEIQFDNCKITISKLYQIENEFGIIELHASGMGYDESGEHCGIAGIISVCIPENIEGDIDNMVLYTDDKMTMDKINNYYRLSFFGEDKKCTGEIRIMEDGKILFNTFEA